MNLPECPRIGGVGLGENIDPMLSAQLDLGLDVDFPLGRRDIAQ
jgi:hypothetical protein